MKFQNGFPTNILMGKLLFIESRPSDPERDKRMELFKQALEEELTPEEAERRKRLMRIIFEKIADTAGFIREDKLETFMAAIPEEDKTLIRIDQVLKVSEQILSSTYKSR